MCGRMPDAEPHALSSTPRSSQQPTTGTLMGTSEATEDFQPDRTSEVSSEEGDTSHVPVGSRLSLSDLPFPPDLFPLGNGVERRPTTTAQLARRIQYWHDLAESLETRAQELQSTAVEALISARAATQHRHRQEEQGQESSRQHTSLGSESPESAQYLQACEAAVELNNLVSQSRIRAAHEYARGSDELHAGRPEEAEDEGEEQ